MRAATPGFAAGVEMGAVNTYNVWEASGLVASRQNPGVLWTHNDSGYRGSVFALATNGAWLAQYQIPDIYSGDFEDISFGPGPLPHFQYLYLGDIGDNFLTRETLRVLRFPEPAASHYQSNAPAFAPILEAQEILLRYPDGPFNCEAMMVDPITGDLFLATKHTNTTRLYRATRAELDGGGTVTLTFIREAAFRSVSAAEISADGSLIALRRPGRGGLWVRQPGESVGDALARASGTIPVIGQPSEPNGESLGFDPTASGYYTLSEGYNQPVYFFARTDTGPPAPSVFVSPGAGWFYNDLGVPFDDTWRTDPGTEWPEGLAPLGYGSGEQTTVSYGGDLFKNSTTYFRRSFSTTNTVTNLVLRVCFNDGLAVYLNGTEILRRNLTPGAVFEDYATASNTNQARVWFSIPVNPALLTNGVNIIAAEVHRAAADGPGLNFDLQLVEAVLEPSPHFTGTRLTNGFYHAALAGPTGLRVRVDHSDGLPLWKTNRFLTLTNGVRGFQEAATNLFRAYRLAH